MWKREIIHGLTCEKIERRNMVVNILCVKYLCILFYALIAIVLAGLRHFFTLL